MIAPPLSLNKSKLVTQAAAKPRVLGQLLALMEESAYSEFEVVEKCLLSMG